jgi:hypothetical protein
MSRVRSITVRRQRIAARHSDITRHRRRLNWARRRAMRR